VSVTDSTVNSGLVGLQIVTAFLVGLVSVGMWSEWLQLEVLDCLNCAGGGSNVLRELLVIYRSVWSDI
jgi:hypothetical protein